MDNNKITKDDCIQKCLIFKSYNPHNNTIPKTGGYSNFSNGYYIIDNDCFNKCIMSHDIKK